ncbi:MAG TPA: hypothetical protein VI456_05475 [Polyangia bacterium]
MENVIEVRYAGVVVGRSTKVRDWGDSGAFIGFAEPLPSGTPLVLKGDGVEQAARVVEVIESADPAVAGMQVTFVDGARPARPATKPAAASPKAAPASPSVAPTTAAAPAVAAPAPVAPPPAVAAEAAPVEISSSTSSAVSGEISAPATAEQGEGDPGQGGGGGGKRRRRRR